MAGSDYFNNFNCSTSRDAAAEGNYASGFGMERKIDLTGYIRWWAPKKTRQSETASSAEDVGRELQELEGSLQASEPYKLPSLGILQKGKVQAPGLSACSILSRSADFKNFLERSSEIQDGAYSKEKDHGKGGHQLFSGGFHKSEVTLGMAEFPVQRTPYTLAPHMSAPVRTSWNPVDHIPDPVFWASLAAPTEQPVLTTHKENEISSPYTYQCQQ